MGYCVPGVIGAKLARPERTVVGIVGDGAARMTGLEMATAVAQGLGVVWFIFNDGELAQIAQAQTVPYNRKTCTVLPALDFEGLARANQVGYELMENDASVDGAIGRALAAAAVGRALFVSDMHGHEVLRVAMDGGVEVLASLDAPPSPSPGTSRRAKKVRSARVGAATAPSMGRPPRRPT